VRVAPSAAIRGRSTTVAAAEAVVGRRATGDALALLRPGGAECRAIHRHVDIRVVRIQVERAPPETATRNVDRAVDRGRTQHVDRRYAATLAVPLERCCAGVHRQRLYRRGRPARFPGGVAVAGAHPSIPRSRPAAHGHELKRRRVQAATALQVAPSTVASSPALDHQQEVVCQERRWPSVQLPITARAPGRGVGGARPVSPAHEFTTALAVDAVKAPPAGLAGPKRASLLRRRPDQSYGL
jgi:hypothetical protein